jgi:hypothetical protein
VEESAEAKSHWSATLDSMILALVYMSFELGRGHETKGEQGRESATSQHAFTNGGQDQQAVCASPRRGIRIQEHIHGRSNGFRKLAMHLLPKFDKGSSQGAVYEVHSDRHSSVRLPWRDIRCSARKAGEVQESEIIHLALDKSTSASESLHDFP